MPLSLGRQRTDPEDVAEAIRQTCRPVVSISMQAYGGASKTIQDGIEAVINLKEQTAAHERVPCPLSNLITSRYNGGSDWTSCRSANPIVGKVIDTSTTIVHVSGRGGHLDRDKNECKYGDKKTHTLQKTIQKM